MTFSELIAQTAAYAWGIPSVVFLVATGIFLTIRLDFIQFRGFSKAVNFLFAKETDAKESGHISKFEALSTALSATVGTGNIAGVATAITLGGPGAIFWMWVTAVVGMATKFASCTLAVKYRQEDANGIVSGGPMYTLKYGLNMPKMGAAFALFTVLASFGIGCTVQANSIVGGLDYIIPGLQAHNVATGIVLSLLVAVVVLGGIKRIAKVASFMVPFMALAYCFAALMILVLNYQAIPTALSNLFNLALNPQAAGAAAMGAAIRYGVARGIFSNEAGLGSAPMAHAVAKTNNPTKQGLIAMLGPFIDTILICTMTALVLVVVGDYNNGLDGAALSAHSFARGLQVLGPSFSLLGSWVVGLGLIFFAYTTMLAWSFYGDTAIRFLFGQTAVMPYRLTFIALVVVGAIAPLRMVWYFADIANILMAVPNLVSVLMLSGLLRREHPINFVAASAC